jgi:hypothetical protein
MGVGGLYLPFVDKEWQSDILHCQIRYPDGTLGGSVDIHESRAEDGSICAQLELRFEDKSSLVTIAEVGLEPQRHAPGRSWVLVEMEQRESFAEPLRFRIHIPGKPPAASVDPWDDEMSAAAVKSAREAISAVRKGCGNSSDCHYPVCDVAPYGSMRKLANDGCISKLVPLEAQPLHASDSGSQ